MDDDPVPGGAPDPSADPIEPPRAAEPAMTAGPAGWVAPSGSSGSRSPVRLLVLGCAGVLLVLVANAVIGLIYLGSQVSTIRDAGGSPPPGGTVNVFDLRVGDCFDEPAANPDGTVVELIARDCAMAHTAELIAIVQVPDAAAYPGADAVAASAEAQCGPAFVSYVGTTPEASIYGVAWYSVTEKGWKGGDRAIDCLAVADDGSPTSGSARGANR